MSGVHLFVCQIILSVQRDWMVHKLILKLNKSFYLSMKSILVSLHDETECWTFSWSVLENRVSMKIESPVYMHLQSTCTFEQNVCNKIHCSWFKFFDTTAATTNHFFNKISNSWIKRFSYPCSFTCIVIVMLAFWELNEIT